MPRHPDTRAELSEETAGAIAELVSRFRPDWPAHAVKAILTSHPKADALPVAIAALRACGNADLPDARAIMWRGPHWSGLEDSMPDRQPKGACSICGKDEAMCYVRPGGDDDHKFTPKPIAYGTDAVRRSSDPRLR